MTPAELREAREQLGLTQKEMAELLGYTGKHAPQQLSRMEQGERRISGAIERIVSLRVALGNLHRAARAVAMQAVAGITRSDELETLLNRIHEAETLTPAPAAALPLFRQAFPDYDDDLDRPEYLLPGFVDNSWKNEPCPSKWNEQLGITVWYDYADPDKRELPHATRFAAVRDHSELSGPGFAEVIIESDDFAEIRKALAELDGRLAPRRGKEEWT